MDKIEKIRKKIKELRELSEDHNYYLDNSEQALGYGLALDDIGKFLDSLPEQPAWSEEDEERLINTSISFLKDFADKGYENAVECIDWLKSKLNGNSGK